MAVSKIKSHPRVIKKQVTVPPITSKGYTTIGVSEPTREAGERIIGWSITGNDPALQGTLIYWGTPPGWWLTVFNAYSGTSGTAWFEVHWLVG